MTLQEQIQEVNLTSVQTFYNVSIKIDGMKVLYRVTITKMFDPEREMITNVSRVQYPNFSKKRTLYGQRNRILKLISDYFGMEAI